MRSEPARSAIRRATEADAPAIAQLAADLGYVADASAIANRLRAILRSSSDLLIVAAQLDTVIAWLQAHAAHIVESGFRVEITGLIVAREHRRCGIGRALVDEAENWARALSAEAVVVRSNTQRVASHAFYPALGYTRTKTQNVYRKSIRSP